MSSGPGAWIGQPDFALLEDTLARALGLWPLPKLGVLLLVAVVIARGGLHPSKPDQEVVAKMPVALADVSGLSPSLLMVLGVVVISFWKPLAFSRYFVVLLPALIPWLSVRLAVVPLTQNFLRRTHGTCG